MDLNVRIGSVRRHFGDDGNGPGFWVRGDEGDGPGPNCLSRGDEGDGPSCYARFGDDGETGT